MIAKGTLVKLIILLLLLILVAAGSVWLLLSGYFLFLGLSICTIAFIAWLVIKLFGRSMSKITFMFNAIENDDFTFRFAENMSISTDRIFNASLNRIRDMIQLAKESIAERERYYEQILSQSSSGIVVADNRGVVYQTNDAALNLLGIHTLTHIRQLEIIAPEVAAAFMATEPREAINISFYNDIEQKRLSLAASYTFLWKVGAVKIITINDIGNQIEDAQVEGWVRLSRVLTHEIMNSLAPITSISDSLRSVSDLQSIYRGLEVINTTGESLLHFVENFRRFTRVTKPSMSDFILYELLERCASLFDREISIECPEKLVIHGDESLIGQVIVNLLKNAIEATQDDLCGKIWIKSTVRANGLPIIEIGNNGEQIPPSVRENIFVPFFTTKQSGSGVGLSLSRQIMRLHGGTLTLSNRADCTEFILIF